VDYPSQVFKAGPWARYFDLVFVFLYAAVAAYIFLATGGRNVMLIVLLVFLVAVHFLFMRQAHSVRISKPGFLEFTRLLRRTEVPIRELQEIRPTSYGMQIAFYFRSAVILMPRNIDGLPTLLRYIHTQNEGAYVHDL